MTHLSRVAATALVVWPLFCGAQESVPPQPRIEPTVASTAISEPAPSTLPAKSLIALALLPASVEGGVVRPLMVRRMVDAVVMSVAGKKDIASAWRVFVASTDRVGLKVSTSGAPASPTQPAVAAAVAEGLVASGVPAKNIVLWDRLGRDMALAGYEDLARHYRVVSTEAAGYDTNARVSAAVMGRLIAGDALFLGNKVGEQTSSTSHLSSVLTGVNKVVNIPALADSVFSGVRGAFSGMVLDNLDNWRRLARAPHFGDPFLPEIYADPRVGGKVVLTILDALRPQYAGGPFSGAEFVVNYGAIFASRDPVALDATGQQLLDDFRKKARFASLVKMTPWIESAQTLGLGHADASDIKLLRTLPEGEVLLEKSP